MKKSLRLGRTSGNEGSGLGGINGGRLSSSSSSSLFPTGSYVDVGTHTWSDWACYIVGMDVGSGSVACISLVSSSASFPAVGECSGSAVAIKAGIS